VRGTEMKIKELKSVRGGGAIGDEEPNISKHIV